MSELHTHSITAYRQVDPTRTIALRNAFARDMKRRFKKIASVIRIGVDVQDAFGLKEGGVPYTPVTHQAQPPGGGAFSFPRSADKLAAFERWLEQQIQAELLVVGELEQVGLGIEGAWTNRYIFDSYKRGIMRSRYEMRRFSNGIPTIDDTGGIGVSMGTPIHLDRLGVLYTRVFSELKGITAQMDQQISRILAQGLADGDNPRLLARKLVAAIDGAGAGELGITDSLGRFIPAARRAEIIARTEIIRAHHQGMIQEYMNWGMEGVTILAEWKTAGDHRVCARCETMEGETFTLEVAMNMIPLHPQCRCLALPYRKEWASLRNLIPENPI